MIDAFFNTPPGIAVYSILVFGGIIGAIWIVGYGCARFIEWIDSRF